MALTAVEEAQLRDLLTEKSALDSLAASEAIIISKLGATKKNLSEVSSAVALGDTDLLFVRQGTTDKASSALTLKNYIAQSFPILEQQDYKASVRVASTAAINLAAPGANIDAVAMVAGDRFLEKDNATLANRGIYIWNGAAVPATRALDADTGAELNGGAIIPVESGTVNADTNWQVTNDGTVTIGTTGLTFQQVGGITQAAADARYITQAAADARYITQAAADARYMGKGAMILRDERASGTAGGTTTGGSNTCVLNTVVANTISGASLSSNQVTLPAGTYRVNGLSFVTNNTFHRAQLYNVTDAVTTVLGASQDGEAGLSNPAFMSGRFTIAAPKVFEFRHQIVTGAATVGFGNATSLLGNEIYRSLEIYKEAI